MTRPVLKVSLIAFLTLAFLSSAGRAQSVLLKSVDAAGTVGFTSNGGADNNVHTSLGFSGGYVLYKNIEVLGEYSHQWMGSTNVLRENIEHYGGGARYYFLANGRFAPYVVATAGYARFDTTQIPPDSLQQTHDLTPDNTAYITAGGGASIYMSSWWGIRPELRWQRELLTDTNSYNLTQGSLSVFFQLGGKSKK